MKVQAIIPIVIFILLVALFGIGLTKDPRLIPSPLIGQPFPEFDLPFLKNLESNIQKSDITGEYMLINVWASWCSACAEEHPLIMELAKRNVIKLVGLNYKDESIAALKWLKNRGDPYVATLVDYDGELGMNLGVYGVPETFLIDPKGNIIYKHVGPLNSEVIENNLLALAKSGRQ
jgi:cytochrome c biogenesis protein CcmG, thiol:disulfide interchange protein DsbE